LKGRALIATPQTWTQGEFARDAYDEPASWRSPKAVQFCLWGALNRVAYELTGDRHQGVRLTDHAAAALRDGETSLSDVNDHGTHVEVLALIDKYLNKKAAQLL
jgi:hypothetical protein